MSRYYREHPDEPVRHDWITPGRFDLPPGCSLREVNERYGEPEERQCRSCGEWFMPVEDTKTCDRCKQPEEDDEPNT